MIQATNNFTVTGNLTKDPEPRKTESGKKFCYVTLAVNGMGDNVDFISIIVWEKLAENIVKYCHKGDCVSLIGSIKTFTKDGKSSIQLNGDAVTFLHKSAKNNTGTTKTEKKEEPKEETFEAAPADPFAAW